MEAARTSEAAEIGELLEAAEKIADRKLAQTPTLISKMGERFGKMSETYKGLEADNR